MAMSTLPLQRPHSLSLEVSTGGGEVQGPEARAAVSQEAVTWWGVHQHPLLCSMCPSCLPCHYIDQQSRPQFSKWGDRFLER